MFSVFYRLLKENCGFYVEVPILDENCKSLLERSRTGRCDQAQMRLSAGQPRSSAHALEPRTITIKRECYAADKNLMHECI
jgi:hypothetical protein